MSPCPVRPLPADVWCRVVLIPIVTCWPQPRGDGSSDVAVEYELEAQHLTLRNVVISIPIP